MSIEFDAEIKRIKKTIEKYSEDDVGHVDYRVRTADDGSRYVRAVFHLKNTMAHQLHEIDFEKLSSSLYRFLTNEYYTTVCVAPTTYTDYSSWRRSSFDRKAAVVVKFYV